MRNLLSDVVYNALVYEATEETLTTILYAPESLASLMRIEQDVKKEEGNNTG